MRREKKLAESQEKYFRQREPLRQKRQHKHNSPQGVIQPDSLCGEYGGCGASDAGTTAANLSEER
jgi:hypothetical protein